MDQGLPIGFDNTATTWQTMPMYAAMQTGQQNQIARDNTALLQQAFQKEQEYKAQERPVLLQNLVKTGVLSEAQARHFDALTGSTNLDTLAKTYTLPGTIQATNAASALKTDQSNVERNTVAGQAHGQVADWLEGPGQFFTPTQKAMYVAQTLGLPTDSVSLERLAADMPKIPDMLRQHAEAAWKNTPATRTDILKENAAQKRVETQVTGQKEVAAEITNRAIQVAKIGHNIDFELAKAEISKDYAAQAGALQKKAELYAAQAQSLDPADPQRAQFLEMANFYSQKTAAAQQMLLASKAAGAGQTKPGTLDVPAMTKLPEARPTNIVAPPVVAPPGMQAPNVGIQPGGPGAKFPVPPTSHLDYLATHRNDPKVIADFDAKYGKGAAAAFLQGK